jgi:paraquat-inducible protein B
MTDHLLVTRKRILSAIWILPLLALAIIGWLLYTGYRDAGVAGLEP